VNDRGDRYFFQKEGGVMSEEVMQWLAEIRTLKQELAQAESDRNAAMESAAHWRKLYNIEARQRREEAQSARAQSQQLQARLEEFVEETRSVSVADLDASIRAELEALDSSDALKEKLIAVIQERDRALESLKTEQENHIETRRSLTAVIGDTIDQLTRMRNEK
jgi:chromosome segregation ATPase